MYQMVELQNKTIVIAGASSGIGRETAVLCSKLGASVVCLARREDKLKELMSELNDNCSYYCCDLADLDSIDSLVKKIVKNVGPIHGYVHSAGISNLRPLSMLKPSDLQTMMTVNYYSFVEMLRCITRKERFESGLSIVGVSSVSSFEGNQSKTAYSASKAAMDASVRCIAKELAPKMVRVNTVAPGIINTDIFKRFIEKAADSEDTKNAVQRQYLGIGEPLDVANLIAFLLSEASRFITGTTIPIDGGRSSS